MGSQDPCSCHHVIFVVVQKRSDADVVDLILYSVPNTLHAQCHVGKRQGKQNVSLGYVACNITPKGGEIPQAWCRVGEMSMESDSHRFS